MLRDAMVVAGRRPWRGTMATVVDNAMCPPTNEKGNDHKTYWDVSDTQSKNYNYDDIVHDHYGQNDKSDECHEQT